jgi:hypothetical protein
VGCGAARKKERNVAQPESAVKQDRLCVARLSADINRMSREVKSTGWGAGGKKLDARAAEWTCANFI